MTTCACCGQAVAATDRVTVRVDDDLLGLCNLAYEEAGRRSSAMVEIAHVAWCMAATTGRWVEDAGVLRSTLATAADRWLVREGARRGPCRLQTSADLKALLSRAERKARASGRQFARPDDFLRALLDTAGDLGSADFAATLRRNRAPSSERSIDARWLADRPEPPRSIERSDDRDEAATEVDTTPSTVSMVRQPGWTRERQLRFDFEARAREARRERRDDAVADLDFAAGGGLSDRLGRQEQEISRLRAIVDRLLGREKAVGEAVASEGSALRATAREHGENDRSTAARHRGGRGEARKQHQRDGRRFLPRWQRLRPLQTAARDQGSCAPPAATAAATPSCVRQPVARGEIGRSAARIRLLPDVGTDAAEPLANEPDNDFEEEPEASSDRLKRFYLAPDDDIVKAPSIGPRTAARLSPAGLMLVRDLLACDPVEVAERVGARYMTADRIAEWKAQARLVCTIPWLRGTHAQLLVGAGYDTLGKIMRADVGKLSSAVLRFAATREGQSILRSAPAPEIDRIACWIENTALAEPQRAA